MTEKENKELLQDEARQDMREAESVASEDIEEAVNDHTADTEDSRDNMNSGDGHCVANASGAKLRIAVFVSVWAVFSVIGLLWFMRPAESAVEKRTLAEFPEFKADEVLNGKFFTALDKWYSDTYPMREELITFSSWLEDFYGIRNEQISGSIEKGDDIPTGTVDLNELAGLDTSWKESETLTPPTFLPGGNAPADTEDSTSTEDTGNTADTSDESDTASPEQPNNPGNSGDNQQAEMAGTLLLSGNAAYGLYYFNAPAAARYCLAVNGLAERLDGKAEVYSMLIPSAGAIMLGKDRFMSYNASDPEAAINWMQDNMSSNVHKINLYSTLNAHRDEYLFFRTDHHWTALGAYYAYTDFCRAKGIEPQALGDYRKISFNNFYGTFHAALGQSSKLLVDRVDAYYPNSTNDMVAYMSNGNGGYNATAWQIIYDVSGWNSGGLYNCFSASDQPLCYAHNPKVTDGSSVLLIKNSFGNAFAPFLIDHYEHIYWVDYRYFAAFCTTEGLWNASIPNLVEDKGIDDVIILSDIATSNDSWHVYNLETIFK